MVLTLKANEIYEVFGRWKLYRVHRRLRKGIKILIAVVLGALLLAGLYLLFNGTILPTLTQKITGLFNYNG